MSGRPSAAHQKHGGGGFSAVNSEDRFKTIETFLYVFLKRINLLGLGLIIKNSNELTSANLC